MATTITNKILAMGYGLAFASPEDVWRRLDTVNELIATEGMDSDLSALSVQLKASMIEQVKKNLHDEMRLAKIKLTPSKAEEKILSLKTKHSCRFRSMIVEDDIIRQQGSYA